MMRAVVLLFSVVTVVSCANLNQQLATSDDAQVIRTDIAFLADDARAGREAGTPGYDSAAEYVATRMNAIGLRPGGNDGSWFQDVPLLSGKAVQSAAAFSITSPDGTVTRLSNREDFVSLPSFATPQADISGELVFVGYAIHAPAFGHDDFEAVDVDGKIAVYFTGAPDVFDSEQRAHFGSGRSKGKELSSRGAIGTITLRTAASQERASWERITSNPDRISMTWIEPGGAPKVAGPNLKVGSLIHDDKAALLFEGAERSFAEVRAEADSEGGVPSGFALKTRAQIGAAYDLTNVQSPNVVGIIEGADPQLKSEYVVLTAHLDHVGTDQRLIDEGKDGIHNGAMDNAAGIAVMLNVAERLRNIEVGRSVIVLAVTAEEKGLLGADYFAHFPTVDRSSIVANVNLDMPLMLHEFVDVIAFGAERSTLGAITKAAADAHNIALTPDPFPEQGIFTRSDHYRFVEQGIPSVYLFPGFGSAGTQVFYDFISTHYHKPSDDLTLPIKYDALAQFADVNFMIARDIANAPMKPTWLEGDFFGDLFAKDR